MFLAHFIALPFVLALSALGSPVELEARTNCSALHHVYLAGTWGAACDTTGQALIKDLESAVPSITTHCVEYFTAPEVVGTVAQGVLMTTQYLNEQAARCPKQCFVLSGYSKGALVVHDLVTIDDKIKSKMFAILVFGDPHRKRNLFPDALWPIKSPKVNMKPRSGYKKPQNVASFCNSGDTLCEQGVEITDPNIDAHTSYDTDGSTGYAAKFVSKKLRSKGRSEK
ncbi:alpha/beta-hydrolase [Ceratobasidium sp. AG-I]|nr:alpha/beta-hydrolase [Ceratobasidium sp. AG-I]